MRDWLLSFASMKNLSICGGRRGRSACASGGRFFEALELRVMLSAAPTGWRAASRLAHTVEPIPAYVHLRGEAGAVGDVAYFSEAGDHGYATGKIATYNARTHQWGEIALSEAHDVDAVVAV